MARGDIKILKGPTVATEYQVAAGTTILAGEPVKLSAVGDQSVVLCATAEPVVTTVFVGIAASDSTATASVAGTVLVYTMTDETVLEAKCVTASAADTAAEIVALSNDVTAFDLTSSTWTVNTSTASGALRIVGGDPTRSVLYLAFRDAGLLV